MYMRVRSLKVSANIQTAMRIRVGSVEVSAYSQTAMYIRVGSVEVSAYSQTAMYVRVGSVEVSANSQTVVDDTQIGKRTIPFSTECRTDISSRLYVTPCGPF
jgi:post-segregation antitoxin (ccd killing protein)